MESDFRSESFKRKLSLMWIARYKHKLLDNQPGRTQTKGTKCFHSFWMLSGICDELVERGRGGGITLQVSKSKGK